MAKSKETKPKKPSIQTTDDGETNPPKPPKGDE